jgi:hypothetical protein
VSDESATAARYRRLRVRIKARERGDAPEP